MLDKFKPPERMLRSIGYGITLIGSRRSFESAWMELTVPTFKDKGHYRYVSGALIGAVRDFFSAKIGDESLLDRGLLDKIFREICMNSAEHNNKKDAAKRIELCCWFGEKGFVLGVSDEGDYFRQSSTKKMFENRVRPSKFPVGWDSGLDWIFDPNVTDIYIDIEKGVLYLSFLIKPLIFNT